MPILKNLYDNKFVSLYTEENITIWAKISLYRSIYNEEYDIITNVKITNNQEVIYSADNIHMAYNKEGLISIVNYVEQIIFYINNSKVDPYWKNKFLNDFFVYMKTIQLELFYKRTKKELEEKQRYIELETIRTKIDTLKEQIQIKYNAKNYIVAYDLFNIAILKNDSSQLNNSKSFMKYILDNKENNLIKNLIVKDIKLNWSESDLNILNELLEA